MTQKASSDGTTYRDRSETGTLNEADEAVTLAVEEQDSFACQITTGLTGTLVAEVSVDGGTTYAATEFASKAGGATSSSLVNPSTGAYDILRTAGCTHVRVRCSAYTSGSAVVVLRGTETPPAAGAGLADIESAVDGLEANTADLDANTDQLEGYVDGLETAVASINTKLDTLDGRVDGLEALLAPLVPGGNLVDTTGTAGTPEQINAGNSQDCRGVMLSNWSSSAIAAGFSNTVDVALKTGVTIGAGKSMFFPCTNTNQIWVDVTTSGDAYGGVYYT